jgi:hypothetical protein
MDGWIDNIHNTYTYIHTYIYSEWAHHEERVGGGAVGEEARGWMNTRSIPYYCAFYCAHCAYCYAHYCAHYYAFYCAHYYAHYYAHYCAFYYAFYCTFYRAHYSAFYHCAVSPTDSLTHGGKPDSSYNIYSSALARSIYIHIHSSALAQRFSMDSLTQH